jgi:hypothetical protein
MDTLNFASLIASASAFKELIAILVVVGTLGYRYVQKKIVREVEGEIAKSFESIVSKLSSKEPSERISSAILLRRFLDKDTSSGVGNMPFAKDAINVIASMLKVENTGEMQKLLADSLKYAHNPFLKVADLQNTNLTEAVLGKVGKEGLDYTKADFYRANLTNASFKGGETKGCKVNLEDAVFYDAILHGTNFTGCNLKGASFAGADIKNATFDFCENIPEDIKKYIDDEKNKESPKNIGKVFISRPTNQTPEQQIIYSSVLDKIRKLGLEPYFIPKNKYQNHCIMERIVQGMSQCSAILVFEFKQYEVTKGDYRKWCSDESRCLVNEGFTSPWLYVETGMAEMKGIPVKVISDLNRDESLFINVCKKDDLIFLDKYSDSAIQNINDSISKWLPAP